MSKRIGLAVVVLLGLCVYFLCAPRDEVERHIRVFKRGSTNERVSAARALGRIKDPRAVGPLIAALNHPGDPVCMAAQDALAEIGTPAIGPLAAFLEVRRAKPEVKNRKVRALEVLSRIEDPRVIDPLLSVLKQDDPSWPYPHQLAHKILLKMADPSEDSSSLLKDPCSVDVLLVRLTDNHWHVREMSARLLGISKDPRAIEPLLRAIDDLYGQVSEAAADALGEARDARVVEALCALLDPKTGTHSSGREVAARLLGTSKDARVVEPLLRAITDTNVKVRKASAISLGQIGDVRAAEPLCALLNDEDENVCRAAAQATRRLASQDQLAESLVHHLADGVGDLKKIKYPFYDGPGILETKHLVWEILTSNKVKQGSVASRPQFVSYDEDVYTDVWSMKRLEDLSVEYMLWTTTEKDRQQIETVPWIIKFRGWGEKVEIMWGDRAPRFFPLAPWCELVRIGQPAVKPLIMSLSDYDDWSVRIAAILALGAIGDERAVEPLLGILRTDSHQNVQAAAAIALGWLADARVTATLVDAAKTGDSQVRAAAALGLGGANDPNVVQTLVDVLVNGDSRLKRAAAHALGEIGEEEVLEPLIVALTDRDPAIRKVVARALGRAGGERAIMALVSSLPDWDAGPFIAESLMKLGWAPHTTRETVYLRICGYERKQAGGPYTYNDSTSRAPTASYLLRDWEQTRNVLLEDIASGNRKRVENAVFTFIVLGREEIVPELVNILDTQNDIRIAETYLNCGHVKLSNAAATWARRRGFVVTEGSGAHEVSWGR